MIDWGHFTPWTSLAGGMLIGTAAAMLLLLNGKIAGISGILGGLLRLSAGGIGWRVLHRRLGGCAAAISAGHAVARSANRCGHWAAHRGRSAGGCWYKLRVGLHPVGTAYVACPGCRLAPWSQQRLSWRLDS
jgi:uncharacterized membrane protein YedE/YeeE